MIRRPPRSTLDRSSAASDVYKRQHQKHAAQILRRGRPFPGELIGLCVDPVEVGGVGDASDSLRLQRVQAVLPVHHRLDLFRRARLPIRRLLYTSDAADERSSVGLGGRRII